MSHLTTHVLDATAGRPARDVAVTLHRCEGADRILVADGVTDADGRLALGPDSLGAGMYALTFETGAYFESIGADTFYPLATITFTVADAPHYHVPLLLSPFAYSTYRGS